MKRVWNISIHAPREGGDVEVPGMDGAIDLFQSTPPARGATMRTSIAWSRRIFQSTPPARGATWASS